MIYVIVFFFTSIVVLAMGLLAYFARLLAELDIKFERTIWKIPFRVLCFSLAFSLLYLVIYLKATEG